MPGFTHQLSDVKQVARELMLAGIHARFPDRRINIRALTFPSTAGVYDPDSIEGKLRSDYRYCTLSGIENKKEIFEKIRGPARELGMTLYLAKDSDLFQDAIPPKQAFHAIFLDYMGWASEEMLMGWEAMLSRGWLVPGGVWGVTLNNGPRSARRRNQELLGKGALVCTLPTFMTRLMQKHGLKPAKKDWVSKYDCRDESSKACSMVLSVIAGHRKRRSYSAY